MSLEAVLYQQNYYNVCLFKFAMLAFNSFSVLGFSFTVVDVAQGN